MCFNPIFHMESHILETIDMIWPHIEEFHVGWGSLTNIQFCIGAFQHPLWWYDFHILIFISYDDDFLLLFMMFGRVKIIPWELNIIWNDKFPNRETTFESLQIS